LSFQFLRFVDDESFPEVGFFPRGDQLFIRTVMYQCRYSHLVHKMRMMHAKLTDKGKIKSNSSESSNF
jgi:hypothetical protein